MGPKRHVTTVVTIRINSETIHEQNNLFAAGSRSFNITGTGKKKKLICRLVLEILPWSIIIWDLYSQRSYLLLLFFHSFINKFGPKQDVWKYVSQRKLYSQEKKNKVQISRHLNCQQKWPSTAFTFRLVLVAMLLLCACYPEANTCVCYEIKAQCLLTKRKFN